MPPKPQTPKIEMIAAKLLQPYDRNSRTHTPEQIAKIGKAISEFGFLVPVVIDANNVVLAGHARLSAALALGIDKIPTLRAAHLTDAQRRAFVIADNRIAEDSGWDMSLLTEEILLLNEEGFDLPALGFSDQEMGDFMAALDYVPPPVNNQFSGVSETHPATVSAADTVIKLGPYRIGLHRAAFLRWEEDMRREFGFGERDVIRGMLTRLGFSPDTDAMRIDQVPTADRTGTF